MVGVVVATHGRLAEELIRTAELVCGPLEKCKAVSVGGPSETAGGALEMEDARTHLAEAIRAVDGGDGVLVLTDMFGGTPANLALTFLDERLEVVTGVNLPMLMKLSTCRTPGAALREIAQMLTGYAQKNITLASELLRIRTRTDRA
jgi:PTS system mannose-specific IIA component